MRKHTSALIAIAAFMAFSCLALSGCGADGMDEDLRKNVGLALGLMVIAASGLGFYASGRHFGRKRQQAARKNKQRSKNKKRR